MSIYDEKPWLAGYPAGRPRAITPEFGDALSMFAATVARTPDSDAIR
jgi:long-chain acyl-CoA synthetase